MTDIKKLVERLPIIARELDEGLPQDATAVAAIKLAASALSSLVAERDADRHDAEQWRAFISSQRFKFMGSAGFDWADSRNPKPIKDYVGLHFGLEVWSDHPAGDDQQGKQGRALLNNYVDELVRRRRAASEPQP